MNIKPNKTGGRAISGDTPYGKFAVAFTQAASGKPRLRIVTQDGKEVGEAFILFRDPQEQADEDARQAGYADAADAQRQIRAMKQGGCCGQPSE